MASVFTPQQQQPANQQNERNRTAGSGRFQNLQRFIGANQDTANQMSGKITNDVNSKFNESKQNVQQIRQNVEQMGQKETQRIGESGQFNQQIGSNPNQILQDQDALGRFRQLQSGQFETLKPQDYKGINQQLTDVQEIGKNLNSEEGRFGLLKRYFGDPDYTMGAQRADQLLLQTNVPFLKNTAQQIQTGVGDIQNQITDNQAFQEQLQQDIANQAGLAATGIRDTLSSTAQKQLSDIDSAYNTARTQQQELQDYLAGKTDLNNDQLSKYLDAGGAFTSAQQAADRLRNTIFGSQDGKSNLFKNFGYDSSKYDDEFTPDPYKSAQENNKARSLYEADKANNQQGYLSEWDGQLKNQLEAFTQNLSSDDLRAVGLNRDFLNSAFDQSRAGTNTISLNKFYDSVNNQLNQSLGGLSQQSLIDELNAARSAGNRFEKDSSGGAMGNIDRLMQFVNLPTNVTREMAASREQADMLDSLNQLNQGSLSGNLNLDQARQQSIDRLLGNINLDAFNKSFGGGRFDNEGNVVDLERWTNRL